MNLAVLVSDYLTYEFEKGALNYYRQCDGCDTDSLPFEVFYRPPGDFGDIMFSYTETGDTVFFGTIIWMGVGELTYPDNFLPSGRFGRLADAVRDPVSIEYFRIDDPLDGRPEYEARADSAWANLKGLDIVLDFAASDYRVGIYLYPPSVGAFDPSEAKWIVFLYRGE